MEIEKLGPEDFIDYPELLTGLAEECSELAKAALKLHRVIMGKNPTPVGFAEARMKLHEETADVQLYLDAMHMNKSVVDRWKRQKRERWMERLREERVKADEARGL